MQGMEAGGKKTVKERGEPRTRAAKIERLYSNLGKHKNAEDNLERESAAGSLRISEKLHRVIFEGVMDGIIYADKTARVIEVNPAFTQITGIPREEVVGESAFNLIWRFAKSKDIPQLLKLVHQTVKGKPVGLFELEINNKIVEVGPLVLSKEAAGFTGVIRDISDRRRAEEALRESEKRFRGVFENSLIGIYWTTPDGRILLANSALVRMLGFTSFEELAQRNLEREGFESGYPRSEFKRLIESDGRINGLESAWRRRDGTTLFVRESAQAIYDNTGNTMYYQGTVEDITERKKAEEAYRSLVDHSLQGLAIFQDGRIIFTNQTMVQITGYTVEEMLTKSPKEIREFVHPKDRELVWERHQQRLQGKLPLERYELRGIRKDGSIRWLQIDANLVEYQGRPAIQAAYLDITERKKAEDELREYQAKLKGMTLEILHTQERERQQLAVGLHDDICQKLVLTKLTLESSLPSISDAKLAASLETAAETIGETIGRAESLTFELSNPVLREFGFVPALEKYLSTEIGGIHGMAYELETDRPLGDLEDDIKTCLFRVTRELLTNVVKHARAQKIKVSVRKTQDKVCVTVQDDGIGFKTAGIKGKDSGTMRFGLFSVREQLEHLGGLLIIDSKPGRGTAVTVVI